MNPNALAWAALYGWPFVVIGVYASRRGTARLARTTAWMMILPVMFLPALLDLPIAALNKHRIAFLSIAAALVLFHPREIVIRDRKGYFPLLALAVFSFGAIQTVRTNGDPLSFGILRIPGLGWRDAAWMIYSFSVDLLLPFAIGQRVIRTERDVRDLLQVLSTCALIYLPFCLVEMRLSPQFSNWVYGYFAHSFAQAMRGSGYRPVVFMNHGLSVGMFLFSGCCAAVALHELRLATRPPPRTRAATTAVVLLLARNLASIVYSLTALLLLRHASARLRALFVTLITTLVVAYPTLRASGAFPTDDVAAFFAQMSPERSRSLMFRFQQEDALLVRAMKRPAFGWGGWGRSRIYHWWGEPGDSWAGARDASITDGTWIIWIGTSGFVGFFASFALLIVPLARFVRNRARMSRTSHTAAGALAIMIALFAVDLLPNAQSDFLPLAYAGALFAACGARRRPNAKPSTETGGDFQTRTRSAAACDGATAAG